MKLTILSELYGCILPSYVRSQRVQFEIGLIFYVIFEKFELLKGFTFVSEKVYPGFFVRTCL